MPINPPPLSPSLQSLGFSRKGAKMDPNPNPPSGEGRNWAEISPDVLSVIFGKVGPVDTLRGAARVCSEWRRVAREPLLWRRVDMTRPGHFNYAEMEAMARLAVDWSAGRMEEFSAHFGSDELLLYIAERANLLKSLHLISCYNISDEGLTEMVKRFPCLEKLEIIFGSFGMKLCESVGQACPQLKVFKLNTKGLSYFMSDSEEELDDTNNCYALGIAKTMHELRQLQLFGNKVTNEGLKAILDSCPHLESLDIRRCFNLNMDASMKAMCSRIRNLRLPEDSADDYEYDAFVVPFDEEDDDIFSEDSEFDDMMYDNDYDYDYIDYDYQHGFGDDNDHWNLYFRL